MSRLLCYCVIRKIDDGTTLASSASLVTCSFLFLIGVHIFGLCSTALITDIIQLSTGYQAPYFLTVCKPNYTSLNVSCKENSYIVEDICSGSDLTVINSGRLEMEIMKTSMLVFLLFMNSLGVSS
jgi:lipid phosphate phosphatase-related protein type 3/4